MMRSVVGTGTHATGFLRAGCSLKRSVCLGRFTLGSRVFVPAAPAAADPCAPPAAPCFWFPLCPSPSSISISAICAAQSSRPSVPHVTNRGMQRQKIPRPATRGAINALQRARCSLLLCTLQKSLGPHPLCYSRTAITRTSPSPTSCWCLAFAASTTLLSDRCRQGAYPADGSAKSAQLTRCTRRQIGTGLPGTLDA